MAIESQHRVGYVNPNGLLNLGLSNRQTGTQWLFVMHCLRCHRNNPTHAHLLPTRLCNHCQGGLPGVELPREDQVRRCSGQVCYDRVSELEATSESD